jgi:hypothetical protein
LSLINCNSERASEYRRDLVGRAVSILILEHEGIACFICYRRASGFTGQLPQQARGIFAGPHPPTVRREVNVTERSPSRLGKTFRVACVPRPQFRCSRIGQRGHIAGEEFHFLRQPALDDRVALFEAKGQRFAIKDLFADSRVDQPAHLVGRRRPAPLRGPRDFELAKIIRRHLDTIVVGRAEGFWMQHPISAEQQRAGHEEVQQWLAQPPLH